MTWATLSTEGVFEEHPGRPVLADLQAAVGGLVERGVPALVVPQGQLKNNLLGMTFLNRLESWEVRGDRLRMRGSP